MLYTSFFLNWAVKHDLPVPEKLQSTVDKYHSKWLGWQGMYEKQKAITEETAASYKKMLEDQREGYQAIIDKQNSEYPEMYKKQREDYASLIKDLHASYKSKITQLEQSVNNSNTSFPANNDIVTDKNKSTLLWLLGVCLHKSWKSGFNANDKGNSLAASILGHIENNNDLIPKAKKAAIATAIREARQTIIDDIAEIAEKAVAHSQRKNTSL